MIAAFRRSAAWVAVAALMGTAACGGFPPPGAGGAAERLIVPSADASARPDARGAPVAAGERAAKARGAISAGGPPAEIPCLDARLDAIAIAGAATLHPAGLDLARADRRRALREHAGGLARDARISLARYAAHLDEAEALLRDAGRPVERAAWAARC